MNRKSTGITCECVGCGATRVVGLEEAKLHSDETTVPMCETCYMPMVAVSAHVKARRKGIDLRDIFR